MDSPVRLQLKRNDYLRHKLFRKINRRRRAKRQLEIEAPVKELKKRLRLKRTFEDGKDGQELPYPLRTSRDYDDNLAYQSGLTRDPKTGHMMSTTQEEYPKERTYLKTPAHPTYSLAVWGDKLGGYDVYNRNGKTYSAPTFSELMYTKPPFKYTIGKDGNINQNGVDLRGAFDVIYDSFGRPSLGQIWNKTKTIVGDIAHFLPRHYGGTVVNMYDNDVASWGQVVGDAIKMYSDKVLHTPDPPRQQRRWNTRRRVLHNRSHPQFTNKEIGIGGKGIGMLVSIPGIILDWNQLKKDWNKPVSEYADGKDGDIITNTRGESYRIDPDLPMYNDDGTLNAVIDNINIYSPRGYREAYERRVNNMLLHTENPLTGYAPGLKLTFPEFDLLAMSDLAKPFVAKGLSKIMNQWRLAKSFKPISNFVPTLDSNLAGIKYAYSRNPEFANIGNLEEYNNYIRTVFPESKIRDINYHMGPKGLQELKPSTGEVWNTNPSARGIYVTPDKSYTQKIRKFTTDRLEKPSIWTYLKRNLTPGGWDKANETFTDIYPVMVDAKNPLYTKGTWTWGIKDNKYQSLMDKYDAIVNSGPKWYQNVNSMPETIVPKTEQTLILGSDADVAGFRRFMSNPQITAENASSITPEQWTAAQDAAIARGDMAEAQRLRDLHFKVSAPDTKIITESGTPLKTYHTSHNRFNSFKQSLDNEYDGFGVGNYFSKDIVNKGPIKYETYLNSTNPYIAKYKQDLPTTDGKSVRFDNINNDYLVRNHSGVFGLDGNEITIYDPKNIKSADAITYDNNGVRIPLGERDNFNINDIRYGLLPLGIGLTGYSLSNYANGKDSGIYIKPQNRGKFTRLKKRTGHSTAWFKAHGTPAQKKMATFALNSKRWHH